MKPNHKRNLLKFSTYIWVILGLFLVLVASFVAYVYAEKEIDRANYIRQQSFLLADELRQSSDDLTRMVRTKFQISAGGNRSLKDAIGKVLTDIAVPLGIKTFIQ